MFFDILGTRPVAGTNIGIVTSIAVVPLSRSVHDYATCVLDYVSLNAFVYSQVSNVAFRR